MPVITRASATQARAPENRLRRGVRRRAVTSQLWRGTGSFAIRAAVMTPPLLAVDLTRPGAGCFGVVIRRSALLAALLAVLLGGCSSDSDRRARVKPSAADRAPPAEPEARLGEEPALVKVPDVTGMDGREAVDAIEAKGLHAVHDEDDPTGCTVDDQDETGEVEPGAEVVLTLECRQRDWENREGRAWELFASSFAWGAEKGCGVLFSFSPTAVLNAGGRAYTRSDCSRAADDDPESANVEVPKEVPDEPGALGTSLGLVHGCNALFDAGPIHVLSNGTRAFTARDCVGALGVRRGPRPSR